MSLTKKDFVAIAGAIADARGASMPVFKTATVLEQAATTYAIQGHNRVFDSLSRSLADVMALTNPKFNRKRFLLACGVSMP